MSGQIGSQAAADSASEGGRKKWATLPFYVQRKSSYKQQGVCCTVELPFTLKKYLKAKEELWTLEYFIMQTKVESSKKSSKRNQKSFKIL